MRGKRAKQLRRFAQLNTVGAPLCAYVHKDHGGGRLYRRIDGSTLAVPRITRLLDPTCTRREYQKLKSWFKRGRH